jgi:hypothetical protein
MTKATDTITNFEDLALHAVDGLLLATHFIKTIVSDDLLPDGLRVAAAEVATVLDLGIEDISFKGLELSEAATAIDTPSDGAI